MPSALLRLAMPVVVVASLAACSSTPSVTGSTTARGAETTASTPAAKPTPKPAFASPLPSEPIPRATQMLAQYDYTGATAAIAKVTGPEADALRKKIAAAKATAKPVADNSTIPHIFYHSLVVDPKRAFTKNQEGVGFSQYMATVSEFRKQMQQMYDRGYVLVHPQRIAARGKDGVMKFQPIVLPPGKKPFVLSLDDLSYYEYMEGKGFASKLIIDDQGLVKNLYTKADGSTETGDFDCVPILDSFIREHPDFSYRGDKGSIAMTGYNGVLGYRTSVRSYKDTPATRAEQAKAKVVADAMKANGWHFASHSWGHINMTRGSVDHIAADAGRWDREVKPILGPTKEMIFPFGADISDVTHYSMANAKYAFLHGKEGFDYFANVDASTPAWTQLTKESFRQARINIDGISLQQAVDGKSKVLANFFDAKSTIDPGRPMPVPTLGGPVAGGG